jgi:hypothetical protein
MQCRRSANKWRCRVFFAAMLIQITQMIGFITQLKMMLQPTK